MLKLAVMASNMLFIGLALYGGDINSDLVICGSCIMIAIVNYGH